MRRGADGTPDTSRAQRINRVWFALTAALVVLVVALLPIAIVSLAADVGRQSRSHVYDFFTGQEIDFNASVPENAAFLNVAVTNIDEARGVATLTISGNRACGAQCVPITAELYAVGQDAARRIGLPPSATFALPNGSGPYTESVTLPVSGWPQRYPFDTYDLTLGFTAESTPPDGAQTTLNAQQARAQNIFVTLEDSVSRFGPTAPTAVDPASVHSPGASHPFSAVERITWQRPAYLKLLTVLLVALVAASAVFAMSLKALEDLLLGIGGIILGVWGVRAIIVQTDLPDVTWVEIALALIILLLLLAVAVRAARHFYRRSGWQWDVAGTGARASSVARAGTTAHDGMTLTDARPPGIPPRARRPRSSSRRRRPGKERAPEPEPTRSNQAGESIPG
jgi:hypothetical protein